MIAPHELKNKTFSRIVRGYNPAEVDEYFDFLIDKYTEAYKATLELEQKYNEIQAKYSELANEEESIRSAILKAQKLGEAIVNNAKKEAKEKENDLIARCDTIIQDAKDKVQEEKENILKLRRSALDFQHKLYDEYVKHVEMIKSMSLDEMIDPDSVIDNKAFNDAKKEALEGKDFDVLVPSDSKDDESDNLN